MSSLLARWRFLDHTPATDLVSVSIRVLSNSKREAVDIIPRIPRIHIIAVFDHPWKVRQASTDRAISRGTSVDTLSQGVGAEVVQLFCSIGNFAANLEGFSIGNAVSTVIIRAVECIAISMSRRRSCGCGGGQD